MRDNEGPNVKTEVKSDVWDKGREGGRKGERKGERKGGGLGGTGVYPGTKYSSTVLSKKQDRDRRRDR